MCDSYLPPFFPSLSTTQVDQGVTAQCSNIVVPVAMALFLKYSHGKCQGCKDDN